MLRKVVSDELAEVAKTYGTPRRTVLLESAGTTVTPTAAAPLEVADDPCFAFLSASGLLARTSSDEPVGEGGGRANHDVVVSAVPTTARGEVGLVTSRGRLLKLSVLDLPALPASANDPNLQGGYPVSELASLEPGERALALSRLATEGPGLAIGTRRGTVKRVNPEVLGRDEWEVIRLDDGDEVVGAVELATGTETLCFITTDAQLLHFGAETVRPQGRSGGGIAGIRVAAGERVAWFGALSGDDNVVVTASGSSTALPGTEPGAVKVTPFSEYPAKGRATGGVRCHRFLKGEDLLVTAWAGDAPARAAAASGAPIDLPEATGKRDGSGTPGSQPIAAVRGSRGSAAGPVRVSSSRDRVCEAAAVTLPAPGRLRLLAAPVVLGLALGGLSACSDDNAGRRATTRAPRRLWPRRRRPSTRPAASTSRSRPRTCPNGVTGITSAEGTGVHPSAFEGTFKLSVSGLPADAEVIAVDGTTYAKNSLLLPDWTPIDPSDYGAPDPAKLMDPDGGFSGLLAAAEDVKAGDSVRGGEDNKEIFTEYTGTISSDAVEALIPTAEGDFDFTYTISDDDELREAVLKGAFYGEDEGEVTYTLNLDDYGTEKEITAP